MRIALPTVHGGLFVLAAVISLAVAYVNVGLATALVAALLTAIAVSSFLMAQFSLYGIELTRETMMDTTCGTKTTLPLRITNRSRFFRQGVVISEKSVEEASAPPKWSTLEEVEQPARTKPRNNAEICFNTCFLSQNILFYK